MKDMSKNRAADPGKRKKKHPHEVVAAAPDMASQTSSYRRGDKCEPDNNLFFEERSNPLSSKGN